jgi:hypothetical protein
MRQVPTIYIIKHATTIERNKCLESRMNEADLFFDNDEWIFIFFKTLRGIIKFYIRFGTAYFFYPYFVCSSAKRHSFKCGTTGEQKRCTLGIFEKGHREN